MLWKKQKYLIPVAVLMLSFSVFCFATVLKTTSVQSGRLIVGTRRAPNDGISQKVHDEHVGDTKGYQSDQIPFTGSGFAKLLLRCWSPSVWCDKDSMTLHMQGSQIPNFLIETDDAGPVPFSKMPSNCGYSVKRAHRDVAFVAKYNACNVVQQGSTYILPLSILGLVVKMVCPVSRPVATLSCNPSAMVANLGLSPDAVRLNVNGEWQSIYQASNCSFSWNAVNGALRLIIPYTSNCWQFQGSEIFLLMQYKDGEFPLSCPAILYTATGPLSTNMQPGSPTDAPQTSTTTAVPARYQQAIRPWLPAAYHPYGYSISWNLPYGLPVSHPITPTDAAARYQQAIKPRLPDMHHPDGYSMPGNLQYGLLGSRPITTIAPNNRAAPASGQQAIKPWLPGTYHPYGYGMPWNVQYGRPASRPVTTTDAPASDQQAIKPWLPGTYHPYGYGMPWNVQHGRPASRPVTSTAAPASDQQAVNTWLPGTYHIYGYVMPWNHRYGRPASHPVTTIAPTITAAPPSDEQAIKPWLHGTHYSYGYGMPWKRQYGLPVYAPVTTMVSPRSSGQVRLYPELPITLSSLPLSGYSSGVKQKYQVLDTTASPNSVTPHKQGCPFANLYKLVSHPGHLFPLQVKGPGK